MVRQKSQIERRAVNSVRLSSSSPLSSKMHVPEKSTPPSYPDEHSKTNAAQVELTAQREVTKIDEKQENEKQQLKQQRVKTGEKQTLLRHTPRLNPLIHLAMSPTAAPNNTPVEENDLQQGVISPSRGEPSGIPGTKPQTEVLPPLPRYGETKQEEKEVAVKFEKKTGTQDFDHVVSADKQQVPKINTRTPSICISSSNTLPNTGKGSSTLYQDSRTPVYLFNDRIDSGQVSETETLHDSRKGEEIQADTGSHQNERMLRQSGHRLEGKKGNGRNIGNPGTVSHDGASGIAAPSSSPILETSSASRDRDLHATGSAMTPKRLHFDCSTEKIDPGAGISSISAQKINITSLLNSRSTAESISPPPSTAGNEYTIHFPSSAASNPPHSTGSFLHPKYQNQNPQVSSTMNRIVSPTYMFETDQVHGPFSNSSSGSNSSGSNNGSTANSNNNNTHITYQPKYFNTKFDELRNRVLLGSSNAFPKVESANKYPYNSTMVNPTLNDQDSNVDAEAAAIISQMRSSPLPPFNEQFGSGNHDSRPNSSLSNQSLQNNAFNPFSKRLLPKPVLRVNQRPLTGNQDELVIMEEEDDDDDGYGDGDYEMTEGGSKAPETVAWNKNGKRRLSRRRSGPPHYQSQLTGIKNEIGDHPDTTAYPAADISENGMHIKRSRSSSLSTEHTGLLSPNSKHAKQLKFKESNYNNDVSNEQMVKSSDQIKKRNATGARSRTGCWICRLRKKKCTEEKPQCQNCVRLHLECFYDIVKPDFISDPAKKAAKLEEIKKKTKEAKRQAMKKKTWL